MLHKGYEVVNGEAQVVKKVLQDEPYLLSDSFETIKMNMDMLQKYYDSLNMYLTNGGDCNRNLTGCLMNMKYTAEWISQFCNELSENVTKVLDKCDDEAMNL